MSQYLLLNRLKVQNANAIAGFTWGFPAITHFLGFTHKLHRDLSHEFEIGFSGCAVISHDYKVHAYKPTFKGRPYGEYEFIQSKNPPYLKGHDKKSSPPIIEEGKMNMTVSLVIELDKKLVGNREKKSDFERAVKRLCMKRRLAGGTILGFDDVVLYGSGSGLQIMRHLMPGFVLMDRSDYLQEHFTNQKKENPETELLDAWLDFSALKQKARPKSDLIAKHLKALVKENKENELFNRIYSDWQNHLKTPYEEGLIPESIKEYFEGLEETEENQELLEQWRKYFDPDDETKADWEYLSKPYPGYLVPIMTGYKAISPLYKPGEVKNVRDKEVPSRFVEAIHSIGEWMAVFRLNDINQSIWRYQVEDEWYLCKQGSEETGHEGFCDSEAVALDFETAFANM